MRIRLDLAYLGTHFSGWQVQKGGAIVRTVQGELFSGLGRLYGVEVAVHGAGRTDSGVHATGQVAHFDAPPAGPRIPPQGVQRALNTMLPEDIRVMRAAEVSPDFHARRSAKAKRYRYRLRRGHFLPPYEGLVEALAGESLHVPLMREAAQSFIGEHDFARFALTGSTVQTTVRTIFDFQIEERGDVLHFVVSGNGFLRGMVRRLVGTLRDVGRGKLALQQAFLNPGRTAEARGLTLEEVHYAESEGTISGTR